MGLDGDRLDGLNLGFAALTTKMLQEFLSIFDPKYTGLEHTKIKNHKFNVNILTYDCGSVHKFYVF